MMRQMSRYWYGWWMWLRAVYLVRTKRHGAGAQPWSLALKTAGCVRYLIDGQHRRPPRLSRWMRQVRAAL